MGKPKKKGRRKSYGRRTTVKKTETERIIRENIMEEEALKIVQKDLNTFKYLTPYILSSKYNLRLSQSKNILRRLHEKDLIILVDKNRRAPLYAPKIKRQQQERK